MVMTSSLAAVTGCSEEDKEFNENDWADIEDKRIDPYTKSKIASELAAWDLVHNLPQSEKILLSVIIPSAVSGPTLTDDIGTSNQFIFKLINGTTKGIVNSSIGWTDVRDVARAHIEALELNILNGERVILCERTLWVKEIVNQLKKEGFKFNFKHAVQKVENKGKKVVVTGPSAGSLKTIEPSLPAFRYLASPPFDHFNSRLITVGLLMVPSALIFPGNRAKRKPKPYP